MLSTPHVALGLALVLIIPNKIIALSMVLLAHFIFDFGLPHWNPALFTEYKKTKKLSLDSLIVIILDSFLALWLLVNVIFFAKATWNQTILLISAAFLSILPDLIKIPVYFFKLNYQVLLSYIKFEHKYQARAKAGIGLLTQIIVLIICLYFTSQKIFRL